jgi:RNA polymerase sigma-70 factor (ECF subfamily)
VSADNELSADTARQFRTTHWSVVLSAADQAAPDAATALERLCRTYWYPLYAFVRREGRGAEDAKDLTQEFFFRFLDRESLRGVHPEKGRFRSFLLASMKNFLAKDWRDANRLKRGGGRQFRPWDEFDAEERYRLEPADDASADALYDRYWAETLVNQVLKRIEAEMHEERLAERFLVLKPFLQGDSAGGSYAEVAVRLGLSEAAVKSAIHRLHKRYAELIREEISQTVASDEEVDGEIRHLISALMS